MPTQTVPFYANTSDNKHCFEASVRMVLKHFLPDRDFTWSQLDHFSAKVPGKVTWPQHLMMRLDQLGFEVISIEGFDGEAFVDEGASYLRRAFGEETAAWQIANSDIAQEQRIYRQIFD